MKKSILLAIALIKIFSVFGQQEHTTNWGNGSPKIRFILRGVDTLLYEEYRENGRILERQWHKDSIYVYDRRGIVIQKRFYNKRAKYKITPVFGITQPDSLIKFFPNGTSIMSKGYTDAKNITYIFKYTFDGRLEGYSSDEKKEDHITKTEFFNSDNQKMNTLWVYPNLELKKDTSYYETGEIRSVFVSKIIEDTILQMKTDTTISFFHFDKQGNSKNLTELTNGNFSIFQCLEAIVHDSIKEKKIEWGGSRNVYPESYPDSFMVKKQDNLVGLVDQKGQWVLPPQFDAIITYRENLFKVKKAGKFGIISKKGKWAIPPQYDGVEFTHLPDIFIVQKTFNRKYITSTKDMDEDFPDFSTTKRESEKGDSSENKGLKATPQYNELPNLSDSYKHTRYGLVDTNSVEVLAPKYKQIRALNWRSPVFLVETGHPNPQKQEDDYTDGHFGLFDVHKGFIVDTGKKRYLDDKSYSAYDYNISSYKDKAYIILTNNKTNKAEIFNHFGKPLFKSAFDKIEIIKDAMAATQFTCGWSYYSYPDRNFYPDFGYLLVHNEGKSGLYSLDNQKWVISPNKYDTIVPFLFKHEERDYPFHGLIDNYDVDAELVLFAKKKEKWWILDKKGQPVWNSYFDTMGEIHIDCPWAKDITCIYKSIFGIRNGKITILTEASYPRQSTFKESVYFEKGENLKVISTFDNQKIHIDKEGVIQNKK